MSSTEDDLVLVLHGLAAEAPSRCSLERTATTRQGRLGALAASAMGVLVAVVALGFLVAGGRAGSPPAAAPPTTPPTSSRPTASAPVTSRADFVPTPGQRHRLLALALKAARMNGDPRPHVSVVGTTVARLYAVYPSYFGVGSLTGTVRAYHLGSAAARVFVLWMVGEFDGNYAMADLVDVRTMRDRVGTFDVDTGYGVRPTILTPLGVVVRLR